MIAAAWLVTGLAAYSSGLVVVAQNAPVTDPAVVVWGGLAALPLVVGLVEILKRAGLGDRWAGVAAVVLGLAGGIGFGRAAGIDLATSIAQGLLVGLGAAGAWSTTKSAGLGR